MTVATIVVIGTLDTKGEEIAYVCGRLRELGCRTLVVDSGILGEPRGIEPDVPAAEVAREGGYELSAVRAAGSRGAAVSLMEHGVRAVCDRLWQEGRLDGVLCLGGMEGALLGRAAVEALPLGVPKLIVTPSASGRRMFAPFVGEADVTLMHSVVDILGVNPISRAVFDNAAAAIAGMARDAGHAAASIEGSVAVTMLGHTTPAVTLIRQRLLTAGLTPVIFHANGVGGRAMEQAARNGQLSGVVDFTLSELANTLMNGIHTTYPERLRVVGECGLPQVVVPGCVDFFNELPRDDLPPEYRSRKRYFHNPASILIRIERDEMIELAAVVAERLSGARGPVVVLAPTRGFSQADFEGGDLWDPSADQAFLETLRARLRPDIPMETYDAHINDPSFAETVASRFLRLLEEA